MSPSFFHFLKVIIRSWPPSEPMAPWWMIEAAVSGWPWRCTVAKGASFNGAWPWLVAWSVTVNM